MGGVYSLQKDYSKAIKSYLEALAIYDQLEPEGIEPSEGKVQLLFRIGEIYFYRLKDYKQALNIYEELLRLHTHWGPMQGAAEDLKDIGCILSKQKKYPEALEKLEEALRIYRDENYVPGIALTQYEIGRIHFKQEKYENAFPYLDDAFKFFEEYAGVHELDDEHSFVNKTRRMWEIVRNNLSKRSPDFER